MNASALASVIAPNILYTQSPSNILIETKNSNSAVELMIKHHKSIFENVTKQETST